MSGPKILIPVETLAETVETIQGIAAILANKVQECRDKGRPGVMMDGWPTMIRGLLYMVDQGKKITGPFTDLDSIDLEKLLLPGMSISKAKSPRKGEKAIDDYRATKVAEKSPKKFTPPRKKKT